MRKVHYKIVLDVFVYEDEDANVGDTLTEAFFWPKDPNEFNENVSDATFDIQDVIVESVEVTDSR